MCHREPEALELLQRVRRKATLVCGGTDAEYTSVVVTGSGTAALEAAFSSIVPRDGRLLVLDNGNYGFRIFSIARVHELDVMHLEFGWGNPFDLERVDAALAADESITHVGMVHHETSSGMLNPLRDVGVIVAKHGRSLAVDAISSLGSQPLDMEADHIDWCVGTANKCLEGLPGVSFVCASRSAIEQLRDIAPGSYYLDLHGHFVAQEHVGAPLFTPALQVLSAFEVALDRTIEETVEARAARYAALAEQVQAGLEELGLECVLPTDQRAHELTLVRVPRGLTYQELHDALKAVGFVIYATQREYGEVFRIANMGQITSAEIKQFLTALGRVVESASTTTASLTEA